MGEGLGERTFFGSSVEVEGLSKVIHYRFLWIMEKKARACTGLLTRFFEVEDNLQRRSPYAPRFSWV